MNRKWVGKMTLLLLAILLLFFILGWKHLAVHIAPKAVLYSALTKAMEQLQPRFENSPLAILQRVADPDGKYSVNVAIQTYNDDLSNLEYRMKFQTDASKQQIAIEGIAGLPETGMGFSCYLDTDFMAFSSEKLLCDQYYGITYSSFLEDVQGISLLNFFISDTMISQWDDYLQEVPLSIKNVSSVICLPRISEQDVDKCILSVLALPCQLERISLSAEQEVWDCDSLTYSFDGEKMNQFLRQNIFPKASEISVTFYLYRNSLVKALVKYTASEQCLLLEGFWGQEPSVNDLSVTGTWRVDNITKYYLATASLIKNDMDEWVLKCVEEEGEDDSGEFQISYAEDTGCVLLSTDEKEEPISFFLRKQENGCQILIENLSKFISFLDVSFPLIMENENSTAEISFHRGSQIIKPQYKNLNEWSIEDFWTLLTSLGSFVGIQFFS